MPIFQVPERFVGKSLTQLQDEGEPLGRADVLASFLKTNENTPFRAGQTFNIGDIPGVDPNVSAELQFLSGSFDPGLSAAQSFQQEQRGRTEEFLGRVQGIPAELEAVRQAIGLPQARETFAGAGQTLRGIQNISRDIPQVQRQATKGFDVSSNQLARIIAQETQELQPSLETATRGFEESSAALQGALGEFGTRTQQIFAPFEIESGILGTQIAQEFDLFKTQISADLSRELQQLQSASAQQLQQMAQSGALEQLNRRAEIEAATQQGEFRDLGDRVVLVDPSTGQEIQSFSKGKLGTLGDGNGNNPGGI